MGERRKNWLEKAMKKRREADQQGTDEYFGVGDYDPNYPPPEPEPKKKKKCFITTLFVEILGKGDDCAELRTLRWFRDRVLSQNDDGRKLLAEYEVLGPRIVEAVSEKGEPERVEIASSRWPEIRSAAELIENGSFSDAVSVYQRMVTDLQREMLSVPSYHAVVDTEE